VTLCYYPKHQGREWTEVVKDDRGYVEFLVSDKGPQMPEERFDMLTDLLEETTPKPSHYRLPPWEL